MKNFLWTGDILTQKTVTTAWHIVCSPTSNGGLSIRPLDLLNKAALLKHMWDILLSDNCWSLFIKGIFKIKHTYASTVYKCSSVWPGFKAALATIDSNAKWIIGDGKSVHLWDDVWLDESKIHVCEALLRHRSSVSSLIADKNWKIPSWFQHQYPFLIPKILQISLPLQTKSDSLIWPFSHKGDLTFKQAFLFLSPSHFVPWTKFLWKSFIPPRVSSTCWKLLHNKHPSQINLQKRGMILASRCEVCKHNEDSLQHTFVNCPFASLLWRWISYIFNINIPSRVSPMQLWEFVYNQHLSSQVFNIWINACLVCFHVLWDTRNNAIFNDHKPILSRTIHHLKCWIREMAFMAPGHMGNSVTDLIILKKLEVKGVFNSSPKIIEVLWSPLTFIGPKLIQMEWL